MTPYSLLDRIGSIIVDRYFVSLNELQNQLLPSTCPFLSETQIAAALTQWSLLVEGTIDKNFELFETYIMKNILALPNDFPIDKFLEEECGEEGRRAPSQNDLKSVEDQLDKITRRLESVIYKYIFIYLIYLFTYLISLYLSISHISHISISQATLRNKSLKGELELLNRQEVGLEHFESHLNCFKSLLQQYKIESFEKIMTNFVSELNSLKSIVNETLLTGSNYLFAKYDSVNEQMGLEEAVDKTLKAESVPSVSYNRILTEMAGLSASQTVEQIDARRKEISLELFEKSKVSSVNDFEKFRTAIQKLNVLSA